MFLYLDCFGLAVGTSADVVVSEMTYTVSSGTLNSTIPYHWLEGLIVDRSCNVFMGMLNTSSTLCSQAVGWKDFSSETSDKLMDDTYLNIYQR